MLHASCHCGEVRIEVGSAPRYLNQCGCSVCRRYGTLWGYYPPDQVRLLCAPEATQAYSWGGGNLEFHRCRRCGCVTHWTATGGDTSRVAVNARLFDPADIASVEVRKSAGPA